MGFNAGPTVAKDKFNVSYISFFPNVVNLLYHFMIIDYEFFLSRIIVCFRVVART